MQDSIKTCRTCQVAKPLDEFHRLSKSTDGRQPRCKECACALARQWNIDNRDRKNATARKSRSEWTPERRQQEQQKGKAYRESHAEERNSKRRAEYWANRDENLARQKAYRETEAGKLARSRARAAWRERDPRAPYRGVLKRVYGITLDEYDAMVLSQEGRCDICDTPMTGANEPCVDHCHAAGTVRGLLCSRCNSGLGHFRDRTDLMLRAIEYLTVSGTAKTA